MARHLIPNLWQFPGAELESRSCSFHMTPEFLPAAGSRGDKHTWEHSVAIPGPWLRKP